MHPQKVFGLSLFLLLAVSSTGSARPYHFSDAPPVTDAGDTQPSPVPSVSGEFKFVEYAVTSSVRYPLVEALDFRRKARAGDVNALDQVPASSWFTPRLGARDISVDELLKGPEVKGPPQAPYTITKTKIKGNSPGFIIKDSRGIKYLIKFDQSEYPALESSVNFIVNRLFWGFGYFVPEDFLIHFNPADAKTGEGVSQDDIDKVYAFSHAEENGSYRAVASGFLDGTVLGHIAQRGTRKGDLNDTIPHENRRVLRALRMISAWLGNSGFRSDNSLEVYSGAPGEGHTIHYILDFGENFGVHGLEKGRAWDGFEYFFSWGDTARRFAGLGIPVKPWEDYKVAPGSTLAHFEADLFEPGEWKETTQFLPIRSSQPDDDYWAAKLIASVKKEHLEALFKAAGHPDENYTREVLDILAKRREKILAYAFSRVSPLEAEGLDAEKLTLKDLGAEHGVESTEYRVRFLNAKGKKVLPEAVMAANGSTLEVATAQGLEAAKGYLIVEVTAVRGSKEAPRPAQFHIRQSSGSPALAGVVH